MKIDSFDTTRLRNDAHFQFHTEFNDLVSKENAQTLDVAALYNAYSQCYKREDDAMKRINKSALTEKIHEADKARDAVFVPAVELSRVMCKHFDQSIAYAANRIRIVFDTYGRLAIKPIDEKTSAIYNVLQELEDAKYKNDIKAVGLNTWLSELKSRNKAFETLVKQRVEESLTRSDIIVKSARQELDKVYRSIIERINAFVVVGDASKYENFIRCINVVIGRYAVKAHTRYRKNKSGGFTPVGDVGGGSHGGGANGGIMYEPPLYDPNKHYSEYNVGDTVRMPNGDVYRVVNLGHVHFAPDSAEGRYSWEMI